MTKLGSVTLGLVFFSHLPGQPKARRGRGAPIAVTGFPVCPEGVPGKSHRRPPVHGNALRGGPAFVYACMVMCVCGLVCVL